MGLLELYDVQRGAKLKYLGSQIAQHFIVSQPVRAFFLTTGVQFVAFYLGPD
jgi:hypothetical protein